MDCKSARSHLNMYLDAALDAPTTAQLDQHLNDCDACAAQFDAETQIEAKLAAALSQPEMPPALWSQLRASVNEDALLGSGGETLPASMPISDTAQPGWKLPVSLAAAAAVAIAVWGYWPVQVDRDYAAFWQTEVPTMLAAGPATDAMVDEAEIVAYLKAQYGLAMAESKTETQGHPVTVDFAQTADFAGRRGIQIRVKCCRRPVMVTLLKASESSNLPEAVNAVVNKARQSTSKQGELNVGVQSIGDYEAIIISEHKLDGMRTFFKRADA